MLVPVLNAILSMFLKKNLCIMLWELLIVFIIIFMYNYYII